MSCGQPHDIDCADVLDRVYEYLDGELDDTAREGVRQHLDECSPCLRQYGLEQVVKSLVVRSCGCEHAPEALRVQVVTRLREIRLQYDVREYRLD